MWYNANNTKTFKTNTDNKEELSGNTRRTRYISDRKGQLMLYLSIVQCITGLNNQEANIKSGTNKE